MTKQVPVRTSPAEAAARPIDRFRRPARFPWPPLRNINVSPKAARRGQRSPQILSRRSRFIHASARYDRLLRERCSQIGRCHHESHGFQRRRIEAEAQIERLGLVRQRVYEQSTNANHFDGVEHASRCVLEQGTTHPAHLVRSRYRQTPQYNNRDGIGHVVPKPARCSRWRHRAHRKGVIADNLHDLAGHEGTRCPTGLVLRCATLQPVIKGRYAGVERIELVMAGEWTRRRQHQRFAHGGSICIVRRSRSLG